MSTELIIEANLSKKILFEALSIAKEFEATYSAYKDDSLVARINASAGKNPVSCRAQEIEIFQKAYAIAQESDGVFDPTIGALTQGTYGFGTKHAHLPSSKELQKAKELVNYKDFMVTQKDVYLKKKGMQLDLGGIGKGFIADKLIRFLQDRGATKGLVSAGGEIVTFGKEYIVALKNPFGEGNCAIIKSSKEAISISTSGDYERYIGSKEHHHILDRTTAKQNHYYSSITLIKNGVDATLLDGVSTIAFNAKKSELAAIAKKFELAIVAITEDKEIYFENFSNLAIKGFEIYPFTGDK
ncbi:FAD:protein FMN transferase [Sulfurimonas sp. SAG-AH-194-L11]|nr:FAD:protein FMN transferase [Sulfurimonas sp. SAG-AH-194-L11]MDF1876803.1 FAD:protein FMN transferase [Sulfurimonas sp. SAG-AH-194-L11]